MTNSLEDKIKEYLDKYHSYRNNLRDLTNNKMAHDIAEICKSDNINNFEEWIKIKGVVIDKDRIIEVLGNFANTLNLEFIDGNIAMQIRRVDIETIADEILKEIKVNII